MPPIFRLYVLLSFAATSSFAAQPNIVLFLVDDMGWTDCGAYGSQYYETPNIDRFAKQGMRFTRAYSQPLCSPTRASILTGQYSSRHGVTSASGHQAPQPSGATLYPEKANPNAPLLMPESRNYLEPSQYTLAEALRDGGYRTGHFGKWHLGLTEPHWPEQQGFQTAFHSEPSAGPPGNYFSPYGVLTPGTPKQKGQKNLTGTITDGAPGEYITDRLTDEALKFIAADASKPFFLNLWHYGVHGPWGHKESYTAEFAQKTDPRGLHGNPVMASMLKSIDESLGRILDKLDELGIAEHTIVLFTSDNGGNIHSMTEADSKRNRGEANHPNTPSYRKWAGFKPPTNNSPLRDGKGRLYEGGVRVPLIVRWPGVIAPGTANDTVVGCTDIYPTLLDLCGIKPSADQIIDGASYAQVLRGTGTLARDSYFIWFPHLVPGVTVYNGNWKMIRRFEERPDDYAGLHELFDLEKDPGEARNLAAEMPDKVKELNSLIDGFVTRTQTRYPKPNPAYKAPDLTAGIVARSCQITLIDGALRVEAEASAKAPFLGTAGLGGLIGPLTLQLRLRSPAGGTARIQWKSADQTEFPATGQIVDFQIPAATAAQDISVTIPVPGQPGVVRLYFPLAAGPVELESLTFTGSDGVRKSWTFRKR
jgi:arylsulfatase A-like enzyme